MNQVRKKLDELKIPARDCNIIISYLSNNKSEKFEKTGFIMYKKFLHSELLRFLSKKYTSNLDSAHKTWSEIAILLNI